MVDVRELRLRLSPWIAFSLGILFLIWAIVENGASVSWTDLVPGAGLIAAGFLLLALLKYLDRPLHHEDAAEQSGDGGLKNE